MATLAEFRQQYPQYDDMSDQDLATSLHDKYYSDMPFDRFAKQIAFTPVPQQSTTDYVLDKADKALNVVTDLVNPGAAVGRAVAPMLVKAAPGILDSAVSAFTAPYRAYTGQLPMTDDAGNVSPQAIAESTNMASWLAGASPAIASKEAANEVAKRTVIDVASKFGRPGNQVNLAAERLGITLPRAVTTDSKIVQSVGKGLENQPLVGSPLLNANEKALSQVDEAAKAVQDEFGTGSIPNAGAQARAAFTKYSKNILADKETANYDSVGDLITQNGMTPLDNTAKVWLDILARRQNATLPEGKAVQLVREAVFRQDAPPVGANLKLPVKPGDTVESVFNLGRGLNYNGIKDLRSYIRETLDSGPDAITQSGFSEKDLKRVYSALSQDLRSSVDRWGGPDAKAAFEQANSFSAKANMEREKLQSILGTNKSDEAVFDTIHKLAGTNSRADINKLFLARKAVDADTWDEIASGVISQMGRDADGNFSPMRFLTARGQLSETGKAMLFNTTGKKGLAKTLDDIEAVSRRMAQVSKNFGNPSGSARNIGIFAAGAGLMTAPISTVSSVVGGNLIARYLAQPVPAKTVLDYLRAAEMAQTKPSNAASQFFSQAATRLGKMAAADMGAPNKAGDLISQLLLQKTAAHDDNNNDQQGRPVTVPEANAEDQSAGPAGQFKGLLVPGNIDLSKRPVVQMQDGPIATVRSMSFNEDGKEILVPTVSPDGKLLTNQQAIDLYHKTGQNLGIFDSPEAATAYAQKLHEAQDKFYNGARDRFNKAYLAGDAA